MKALIIKYMDQTNKSYLILNIRCMIEKLMKLVIYLWGINIINYQMENKLYVTKFWAQLQQKNYI